MLSYATITKHLQKDGFYYPIPLLSSQECDYYLAKCWELEAALGGKPAALTLTQLHLAFGWAYKLAVKAAALDLTAELLGPNIAIWSTSLFSKHGQDDRYVGWHQDGKYWGLDCEVVSIWIALTESNSENGCLRVVRGSHCSGLLPHTEGASPLNVLSRKQEIAAPFDQDRIVDVILMAGEASTHHMHIIHGSLANTSGKPRVGFVVRYVSPEALQAGARTELMLVQGDPAAFGRSSLVSPPEVDHLSPESLAHFAAGRHAFLQGVHGK